MVNRSYHTSVIQIVRYHLRNTHDCSFADSLFFLNGRLRHIARIQCHYSDDIMSAVASQITSFTIVYSTIYSRRRSKKNQISASLAFLCAGNSPMTGEYPAQRASIAENVSIGWRLHGVNWIWKLESLCSAKLFTRWSYIENGRTIRINAFCFTHDRTPICF